MADEHKKKNKKNTQTHNKYVYKWWINSTRQNTKPAKDTTALFQTD